MTTTINAKSTGIGGLDVAGDASGALGLQTGGVTAVTIDTSQNVGIGTTAPLSRLNSVASNAAAVTALTLQNSNSGFAADEAVDIDFGVGSSTTASHGKLRVANTTATSGSNSYMSFYTRASDVLAEKMRIDSSGNVGIGTASPVAQLGIYGSGQTTAAMSTSTNLGGTLYLRDSGGAPGNGGALIFGALQGAFTAIKGLITDGANNTLGALAFSTRNASTDSTLTERMRIDANGNVLIGVSSGYTSRLVVQGTASAASCDVGVGANGNNAFSFRNQSNSYVGQITVNVSSTAYTTTSDYRLKENIAPMTGALDKVAQLKPVTYTWKSDGSDGQGFIAHELQAVIPECVTGQKDAVNEDGSIKPQGIDTSFLVATLTAAIQEQQTIINDLKARIETLESK